LQVRVGTTEISVEDETITVFRTHEAYGEVFGWIFEAPDF
jgi:hypothetical protein